MLIMPLGDIFISEFKIDTQEYSFLVSAYAFAAFLAGMVGMLFLDFFDRKLALQISYGGFAVGSFLCAMSSTYIQLLGYRFFTGLFGGVLGAIVLSIVADLFKFKERGWAMGIVMTAFSAASAIGVPFGLLLADLHGWRFPFYVLGGTGMAISILIFFIFPSMTNHFESVDRKRKPLDTIGLIISDKNQINALITGMILVLGHFLIIPFITPYMIRNVGLEQEEIKYIFLIGGILTVFTAPFIGKMVDKYGVMKIFISVCVLSFIPTILITHLPESALYIALIATSLFFIFGSGRFIAPNTLITAAPTPENRGSFMSLKSALQQLAIALASFLAGTIVFITDTGEIRNYNYVAYVSIVVIIISIFLTNRLKVAKGN